jgi:hypothetical protein
MLQWMLFWLLLALFLLDVVATSLKKNRILEDGVSAGQIAILAVWLVLEVLTVLAFVSKQTIYPWYVRHYVKPYRWWKVRVSEDGLQGEYGSAFFGRWMRRCQFSFEYICVFVNVTYTFDSGALDSDTNVPHGLGRWWDNALTGEYLYGYWKKGIPVGPFVSTEHGTGFGTQSVRVGFASCSEDPWDRTSWWPRFHPKKLQYGNASVECSVSGLFFSHLPSAQWSGRWYEKYYDDPEDVGTPDGILEALDRNTIEALEATDAMTSPKRLEKALVIRWGADTPGFQVDGFEPWKGGSKKTTNTNQLVIIRNSKEEDELRQAEARSDEDSTKDAKSPNSQIDESPKLEIGGAFITRKDSVRINGWIPVLSSNPASSSEEALVFVHGFNCTLKKAVEVLSSFFVQ